MLQVEFWFFFFCVCELVLFRFIFRWLIWRRNWMRWKFCWETSLALVNRTKYWAVLAVYLIKYWDQWLLKSLFDQFNTRSFLFSSAVVRTNGHWQLDRCGPINNRNRLCFDISVEQLPQKLCRRYTRREDCGTGIYSCGGKRAVKQFEVCKSPKGHVF